MPPPAGEEAIPERVVLFRMRTLLAGLGVLLAPAVVLGFVFLARAGLTLIAIRSSSTWPSIREWSSSSGEAGTVPAVVALGLIGATTSSRATPCDR